MLRGARVVHVADKGYGAALRGGIAAARGQYVVMGDADIELRLRRHTQVPPPNWRAGSDLVMGNRFRGGIEPHAMPPLHKYLGQSRAHGHRPPFLPL